MAARLRVAAGLLGIALSACVLNVDSGDDGFAADAGPDAAQGQPDAPSGVPDADVPDAAPPPDPRMGNVVTYSFDNWPAGLVFDRSGNGLDGNMSGAATIGMDSVYGDAIELDGGYVFVPKDPRIAKAPPITIEAWVWRNTVVDQDTIFSDEDDLLTPSATYHLAMLAAGNGMQFHTNNGCTGGTVTITSTETDVAAVVWTHVAVAWDGEKIRFYLDGVLTDTQDLVAIPCVVDGNHFRIGEEADGGGSHRGGIDDFKLSSYAKSGEQIEASMNYDLGALPSSCGDHVVEGPEQCDVRSACCAASTCSFRTDGTSCGAGTCQLGVCVSGGGRVSADLVALYEFNDGSGATVADSVAPSLDLTIADPLNVTWASNRLTVDIATIIQSAEPATKIATAVQASNEVTVEAWVDPANVTQAGPARIATMSIDISTRNFTLGQLGSRYSVRVLSTLTQNNGTPDVQSRLGDLDTSLTHVVVTRAADGTRTLYIDGRPRATNYAGDDFANWDATHPLALANEITLNRPWLGTLHLVAVYSRALTAEEVGRNFTAGAN